MKVKPLKEEQTNEYTTIYWFEVQEFDVPIIYGIENNEGIISLLNEDKHVLIKLMSEGSNTEKRIFNCLLKTLKYINPL